MSLGVGNPPAEANPLHAEILKMVDHKNIIQLKDYFDEEKALCLVLELATGGDIVEKVSFRLLTAHIFVGFLLRRMRNILAHVEPVFITAAKPSCVLSLCSCAFMGDRTCNFNVQQCFVVDAPCTKAAYYSKPNM